MYDLFYKYLILNGKATLTGIGSFILDQVPASMDFEQKKLNPPSQKITLQASENPVDVFLFNNLVATELNISTAEANEKFEAFVADIKSQANTHGTVILPGIGKLTRGVEGSFGIEPEIESKQVLPDLWISKTQAANTSLLDVYSNAQPTIIRRPGYQEKTDVLVAAESEDYWWVWAIILAIMGLGALLYYYI